jgi:hypothetical protein
VLILRTRYISSSVSEGILQNVHASRYALLEIDASDEWISRCHLFGKVDDQIVEQAPCSLLMVHRYEPIIIHWFNRQIKKLARITTNCIF